MNRTVQILRFFSLLLFILINPLSLAAEASADEARSLIKSTADEVIARVKTERDDLSKDTDRLYRLVNSTIVPHVDFHRMSRWILGKHWRKASTIQQSQFVEEFKKLLIKTYATALLKFSDEEIIYLPAKDQVEDGRVTIRSEVRRADGQRFDVQYRMHHKDQDWKVYDISVDGVSLVSTYRNSFSTKIGKEGIEGLLAELFEKNKGLKI